MVFYFPLPISLSTSPFLCVLLERYENVIKIVYNMKYKDTGYMNILLAQRLTP